MVFPEVHFGHVPCAWAARLSARFCKESLDMIIVFDWLRKF